MGMAIFSLDIIHTWVKIRSAQKICNEEKFIPPAKIPLEFSENDGRLFKQILFE